MVVLYIFFSEHIDFNFEKNVWIKYTTLELFQ